MFLRMSDEKQSTTEPTVVISTSEVSGGKLKSRLTKKHVLIAVISLLITGLVVTAVLVGIRIYTDSNLEVLKYTMQNKGVDQNVSTSENSVIYHVRRDNVDAWIVQDFDTGLQVSKVLSDGRAVCYVTALNRSVATEPSSIPSTAPDVKDNSPSSSVVYQVMPDQIPDVSFLGKKASTLCQNIPTYHAVPDCGKRADNGANIMQNMSSIADHRSKRTPLYNCATARNAYGTFTCSCGCCSIVCGVFYSSQIPCTYYNGQYWCTFYVLTNYWWGVVDLHPYGCWYNNRYYNNPC